MRGCLKDLPTYQWLTVLPQLVSRICHQNEETVRLVKHIITSVLRQYPQQALWTMAAVTKSTVSSRREAAAEIIQAARRGSTQGGYNSMFVQFATLVDHLIRLCFHPGQTKARTINILTEFSALKRMMPVEIIMPTQESLTVNLPLYDANLTDSGTSDIFSYSDLPTISGISDEAEILSSLQRPKKVRPNLVALFFFFFYFSCYFHFFGSSIANYSPQKECLKIEFLNLISKFGYFI